MNYTIKYNLSCIMVEIVQFFLQCINVNIAHIFHQFLIRTFFEKQYPFVLTFSK